VALEPDAVHRGLDGAVQKLHDQHQQHRGDEQRTLHAGMPEPQTERYDDDSEAEFLPERGLFAKAAGEAEPAGPRGAQDACDAAGLRTIGQRDPGRGGGAVT